MDPTLLVVRITVCIESFLIVAGALLFDEKICQMTELCWFGLWMLEFFTHSSKEQLFVSPAFFEHG
jgi:hypothetical protein